MIDSIWPIVVIKTDTTSLGPSWLESYNNERTLHIPQTPGQEPRLQILFGVEEQSINLIF